MKDEVMNLFVKNNIQIDKDVFEYGFVIFEKYISFFLLSMLLSICCGVIISSILFTSFYIPLRRYAGGFHFDSSKLCILFSSLICVCMAKVSEIMRIPFSINIFLIILCLIIMAILAPIDHPNKRLNGNEKRDCKRKLLMIEFFYLFLGCFFKWIKWDSYLVLLTMVFMGCSLSLVIAKTNKRIVKS